MFNRLPGAPAGYDQALLEVKQRDPGRRANGVANLGVFGGPDAVKAVKGFVEDESEAVRVAAQYALALLGQAEALPKLIAHLADERHEFRKRAAVALTSVSGAGIACDHANLESCTAAKKDYEAWWKKSGAGLAWDAKKKTFGSGAGAETKAKKK
ncbi:MAG: HEAT repeat domain-containing protein [Planctomycetia bacterium]|nr:HEAT repeat domain-containing protein [Planctomycetia bacterium]